MLKRKCDSGEVVGKGRKQRSDKGKKWAWKGDKEDSGDKEPQPKKRRTCVSKTMKTQLPSTYKSSEMIDDSDDGENT
jgi:hypothetical protein